MNEKTHYRKAFNSPYLSSADVSEPVVLTIARVSLEGDKSKKSKDLFNTAYFVEPEIRKGEKLKPMILNAHNSKMIYGFTGSHFIEDWVNVRIGVYVDKNVRFGRDTVEGLRISPEQPEVRAQIEQGTQNWDNAIAAYKRDKNLDAVKKRIDVSPESEKLIIEQANGVS